jgi:formate C-acetyltransferase
MERREFVGGKWQLVIDVRDFIQKHYTLYEGDARFLAGPTEQTQKVWARCL